MTTTDLINIEFEKSMVYEHIGYDAGIVPPSRVSSLIDEYMENAHSLIESSCAHVIRRVEHAKDPFAHIEGSITFKSKVIADLLEQCDKVAIFVVTIGDYLEEMASWLSKNNLILQSVLLEAIGSQAVEKVADALQDQIRILAADQGLVISQRFSPGYCDWDIEQQTEVFKAINGETIEVELTNECLMIPRKSISGIIGIGPAINGVHKYRPCGTCDKLDCRGRR